MFTIAVFKLKDIYDARESANDVQHKMTVVYDRYHDEINRMASLPIVKESAVWHQNNHLVYEEFYSFNNLQDVKSVFYLIDKNNIFVASTAEPNAVIEQELILKLIPRLKKNPNHTLIDVDKTYYSHDKTSTVTFAKVVKKEGKVVGYLVYKLFEGDFQRLVFGEKADITVVTDDYDYLVVTTNDIVKGLMNKFSPESMRESTIRIKDESYYYTKIADNYFTVYALINQKGDYTYLILYMVFLLLTCGILFVIIQVLAEKMARKNVASIDKLLFAVSQLEKGDMHAYVDIKTGDEFEMLANEFNSMLDNLNELMKRNKELSHIRKVNEIKLLQSQFNPHFLFNVLAMLRYTMVNDVEKAEEIIMSLSNLLRYSIHDKMKEVPFVKDMAYIRDYLKLHQLRFKERLTVDLQINENIEKALIPKLLLQPMIENAIKYGYRHQMTLHIRIKAQLLKERILFTVEDDGGGMDENTLQRIKINLLDSENGMKGIGLYNANRRLLLLYGEHAGLSIESTLGSGTKITFQIPYEKGASSDV
ncbi:sensor histidine kinase [Virgibacillus halophilus]